MSKRTPGELQVPEGLCQVFALCRALSERRAKGGGKVASDLASAARRRDKPRLPVDRVADVESALRTRLPDGLWSIIASTVPLLTDPYDLRMDALFDHSAAAKQSGCPPQLIAIGRETEGRTYLCVPRHTEPDGPVVVWDERDGTTESTSVSKWAKDVLTRRLGQAPAAFARSIKSAGTKLAKTDGYAPCLMSADESSAPRRVSHPKFGEGVIVNEEGSGDGCKVTVDFEDSQRRTILARFVVRIED